MKALWVIATAASLTVAMANAQTKQQQNPNTNPNAQERAQESAQEKASGIHDAVDIVRGPNIEHLTPTSAALAWTTNKVAATNVRYGTEAVEPSRHAYVPGGSLEHRVELKNLKPGTTYHYEIETRYGKDRYKGSFQTPKG
jgi:hypothetical protein